MSNQTDEKFFQDDIGQTPGKILENAPVTPRKPAIINNNNIAKKTQDEETIDLRQIFGLLWVNKILIILLGLCVAVIAFVYSKFVITPLYSASTQILVMNENSGTGNTKTDGKSVSVSDLQSSTFLVKDYTYMITSKPVMKSVIDEYGLDLTYSGLASKVSVTSPTDTRILTITVTDPDPVMSKNLADSIRDAAIKHIQGIIGVDTVKAIDGDIGAVTPTSPSSPNVSRNTLLGMLIGIFIACAIVVLRFMLDDSIKTQEDVENKIGLSVLANMPYKENIEEGLYDNDPEKKEKNKLKLRQNGQVIPTNKDIRISKIISEAYKKLRSNIQFSGRHVRVIGITSTVPNEGKSVLSLNLAISLAELGKRVIFIDADLRKSVLVGRYKIGKQVKGLTHYLSGVNSFDEVVCETNVKNLHMVFSGIVPPNPAELLESVYFRELVKQLRQAYDYVVIDTPPVGTVIDGAIIGKECDGVVMVVGSGDISYKLVERAKEQLETSGSRILGVALNKVPMDKGKGYYGKYYGGYYGGYYGYGNYSYGSYENEEASKDKK